MYPTRRFPRFALLASLLIIALTPSAFAQELYVSSMFLPRDTFTTSIEGPLMDLSGTLYALNYQRPGTVAAVTPDGEVTLIAELPEGSQGNGTQMDSAGRIIITDKVKHHIFAVDRESHAVSVVVRNDDMHEPNDITITAGDVLYASDPDWKRVNGRVWRIEDGVMTVVADSMGTVNGIEISPDGKTLYVNESMEARIWAFDVAADGSLSNRRLFHAFDEDALDAMRCDVAGNLFAARYGHGTIAMFSPSGELIREIGFDGKRPSNMAFGGPDGCTVYVTVADLGTIETFRAEHPGRLWQLMRDRAAAK